MTKKMARLLLLLHHHTTLSSSLGLNFSEWESNIAKKLHRTTHIPKQDTKNDPRDAKIENKQLFDCYDVVYDICDICASLGRPLNKIEVSLQHVSEALDECIQADFAVFISTTTITKFQTLWMFSQRTGSAGLLHHAPQRI